MKSRLTRRKKIQLRNRSKVLGTAERPRLAVYRSNKAIYCQLINDQEGITLTSANSLKLQGGQTKVETSKQVGLEIADKAKSLNIESVVFDRGGYLYHGRVKALAEGAREGGLQF